MFFERKNFFHVFAKRLCERDFLPFSEEILLKINLKQDETCNFTLLFLRHSSSRCFLLRHNFYRLENYRNWCHFLWTVVFSCLFFPNSTWNRQNCLFHDSTNANILRWKHEEWASKAFSWVKIHFIFTFRMYIAGNAILTDTHIHPRAQCSAEKLNWAFSVVSYKRQHNLASQRLMSWKQFWTAFSSCHQMIKIYINTRNTKKRIRICDWFIRCSFVFHISCAMHIISWRMKRSWTWTMTNESWKMCTTHVMTITPNETDVKCMSERENVLTRAVNIKQHTNLYVRILHS